MEYLTVALVLIAIGVVLLGTEILMPTGGFLVVGALLFFAVGVGTILYYGDTLEAVVAVAGLAVGLPAAGVVAVSAYRRLSLRSALDSGSEEEADVTHGAKLDSLKGRVGKALSPLRPSGTVEFDGRRYDAITEGTMIDAGVWVRCVAVKPGTAVVRQLETPQDIADIGLDESPKASKPSDDFDLG